MAWVKNNKKVVATGVAFVVGGLSAIGYGIPVEFVNLLYTVLGLGAIQ